MRKILLIALTIGLFPVSQGALKAQQPTAAQYLAYGKALYEEKTPFKAIQYIDAAVRLDQQNTKAMLLLGDAYLMANKFQDAIKWYKYVRTVDPGEINGFYKEANVWVILGKKDRAIGLLQQALRLDPKAAWLKKILVNLRGSDEPPEFPPGSIYIFEDAYAFGVVQNKDNKKSKILIDKKVKKFGSASMCYRLNTRKENNINLNFLGAWKSSNVHFPGDLTRFRKKGALVFWIKGIFEGEFFDVGFKAIPKEGVSEKDTPKTSMSVGNFAFITTEWQKVIVPFSELPSSGFVWRPVLTDKGDLTDQERRVDMVLNWSKVDSFYIRADKLFRKERKFWIDHMVLVPEYDRQEFEFLRNAARKKERVYRGTDDFVIFHDEPLTTWWAYPRPYAYVVRDETVFKEGKFSSQFVMDPKDWTGGGMTLPEIDLSPIREKGALEYWVRGENGDEQFGNGLCCLTKEVTYNIVSACPNIRMYLDISTKWRHVSIPLADFPSDGEYWDNAYTYKTPAPMDWTRVMEISWDTSPVAEKEHTWYLDDIRIVPKSTHTSALYLRSSQKRQMKLTAEALKKQKKDAEAAPAPAK